MGLQEIDLEKQKKEQEIIQQLFLCIDESKSLVFNAGAGSGKTYALVECLKYVIQSYGKQLKEHNQRIMCITYTNVAANNIKEKIGNSNLVLVSTIHERLWQLINTFQPELLTLHKEKIEEIIKKDQQELTDETNKNAKVYKVYRDLPAEDRKKFEDTVWDHKEEFYQGYMMNSTEFREHYSPFVKQYEDIMKNVDYFRKIVGKVYEMKRFEICLENIQQGKLKRVEYNAMYNRDRLDRMRISHDTLLEYGQKIILSHSILQQIISDQFPFIFIDEYQDTSKKVVDIMAILDEHAKKIRHKFFVGYYGDHAQNIYDDGVGSRLLEKHSGLEHINKEFNRRSYKEIIDAANKIRLDELQQSSIYEDCIGGSVEYCRNDSLETVLQKCKSEWENTPKNKIHCFMLKNEEVADNIGISTLYQVFRKAKAYKGARYDQLNTELLSNDREKLGEAASFLYRILKFYEDIKWEETSVEDILYGGINKLNISELKVIKRQLQEIEGDTLGDFLTNICDCYQKGEKNVRTIIQTVLDLEKIAYDYAFGFFMQTLELKDAQEEEKDEDESLNRIRELMAISMEELKKWFYYIKRKEENEVIYHTFHGTKGLEFKNVVIVLEDGFGAKKEDKVLLKSFLEDYLTLETQQQVIKHEKARNLLYVAVTRAIENLKVIYLGNSERAEKTLDYIFNQKEK